MGQILINKEDGQVHDTMAPSAGEYDDPYYNLIFIAVHANPNFFSFLNKLDSKLEFKWSRWNEFRSVLRPMTFHCFLVKGYRTGTSSGHGFTPVEHIAEFPGVHVARVYNAEYLHRWQAFADEDCRTITKATREFVNEMVGFKGVQDAVLEVVRESAEAHFMTSDRLKVLQQSLTGTPPPDVDLDAIVDTGPLVEMMCATLVEDW